MAGIRGIWQLFELARIRIKELNYQGCTVHSIYVLVKSESWSKLRAITYVNLTYYILWVTNKSIHYCGIRLYESTFLWFIADRILCILSRIFWNIFSGCKYYINLYVVLTRTFIHRTLSPTYKQVLVREGLMSS